MDVFTVMEGRIDDSLEHLGELIRGRALRERSFVVLSDQRPVPHFDLRPTRRIRPFRLPG